MLPSSRPSGRPAGRRSSGLRADVPGDVPCILDAKRGDIATSAERYAAALFGHLGADGVTVSPYLGEDAVEPFLATGDRLVYVLARTSNPSAGRFQSLVVDGEPIHLQRRALGRGAVDRRPRRSGRRRDGSRRTGATARGGARAGVPDPGRRRAGRRCRSGRARRRRERGPRASSMCRVRSRSHRPARIGRRPPPRPHRPIRRSWRTRC